MSYQAMKRHGGGNSLAVQWLGLHTSTAGGPVSITGQGAKIPQAAQPKKKKKKNRRRATLNTYY